MIEKFIEGTDYQYSIREDGVVIKHYNILKNRKRVYVKSLIKGHLYQGIKVDGPNSRIFNIKGKIYSRRILMFTYYGYKFCNNKCCKNKVNNLNDLYCSCCKIVNTKNSYRKWKLKDPEKNNLKKRESMKRHVDSITKLYVANTLNILVSEVSDKLYEDHKNLILLKRKIAREHNISINSLK
jgi:hypothetical protein